MSDYRTNPSITDTDTGEAKGVNPCPASSHSPVWYLTFYLAGLLLTNGLADAVNNILHDVL